MVAIGATSVAYATPALQLPWPTGQSHYIWGGANGYGCGDHIGRDAYAIDFQLTTGNAVSAVAPGVAHRGPFQQTGYGNFIWIQHDGGIVSIYGHLSSFAVADGQAVSRGQTIGAAGSTGNSTGPHLHFALHAGASNYYSGTGLLPEPMSGYTGFGAYGWCHGGGSPMYTSSPPAGDGDGGGGGGGGGTSAPMTRNLLTNGSFDVDAFKGWDSFPNGFINYASRDDPGGAKEGHGYGAVETDVAGRSFAQDIPISPQPGQSYTFSAWIRSSTDTPVSGVLAVHGLGGTPKEEHTGFTVGRKWTLVSAPFHVINSGHTALRAEIYLDTTGIDYNLDGAQFIDSGLTNASYDIDAFKGWDKFPNGFINYSSRDDPGGAKEGHGYGAVETDVAGRSFAQDIAISPQPGQSYRFSAWIRSSTDAPVSGTMAVHGLGGTPKEEHTGFTVGRKWTLVSAPFHVINGGHTALRAEIYLGTPGVDYHVDGAQFVNSGLTNGSFDVDAFKGWDAFPNGFINYASRDDPGGAKEGHGYGAVETDVAGRSFAQDIPISPQPGQSYTFSAWIRSSTDTPVSGVLAVHGLGGTPKEEHTGFTVGRKWTLVSAPFHVINSGHTALRAEIYLDTTGIDYNIDGASFAAGNARSPIAAPASVQSPVVSGLAYVAERVSCTHDRWDAPPDRTSVRWRRDGSPIAGAESVSYTPVADDEGHQLSCVKTAENDGGTADAASSAVTVKPAGPHTTITSGPAGPIRTTAAAFGFTSSRAGSSFQCRLDIGATNGSWEVCGSRKSYSGLAEGSHRFYVRAVDPDGVRDPSPAYRDFRVDLTAPETTITSGLSGPIKTAAPSFAFASSETGSSFRCRFDKDGVVGTWVACRSPKAFSGLTEGSYRFYVQAVDAAGNRDATPSTRWFRVDLTAPQTTVTSAALGSSSASLGFSSSESGGSFRCRLDKDGVIGTWEGCRSPKAYPALAAGSYRFYVQAVDAAGNRDPSPATRWFSVAG